MTNKSEYIFTAMRSIREENDFTITQVANDLQLDRRVLQEIETGKKGTNAKRAHRIAMYLNTPIEILFTPVYYQAKSFENVG
ncbi:helix-turn-helix transcriptional regulator [Bacillus cereus]|uniref:helix-turn-helix domain-containing protein n=1 Tax=Bacillus cereus TaxID=1396 RepID=UPI003012E71F